MRRVVEAMLVLVWIALIAGISCQPYFADGVSIPGLPALTSTSFVAGRFGSTGAAFSYVLSGRNASGNAEMWHIRFESGSFVVEALPVLNVFVPVFGCGSTALDYNLDGHVDLLLCGDDGLEVPHMQLLVNNGSGWFTNRREPVAQFVVPIYSGAVLAADLDSDGDVS